MTDRKSKKPAQQAASGVSRRTFLKTTGAAAGLAAGTGAITGFPYVHAQEPGTLRYLGHFGRRRQARRYPAKQL